MEHSKGINVKTTLDVIGELLRSKRRTWLSATDLADQAKVCRGTAHKCAKRWVDLGQVESKLEACPNPPWNNRRRVYRWTGKKA